MIDPAYAVIVSAVGLALSQVISAWRTNSKIAAVKEKVDGNFSDLMAENRALKQDKAVLTERLLTTMPTEKPSL